MSSHLLVPVPSHMSYSSSRALHRAHHLRSCTLRSGNIAKPYEMCGEHRGAHCLIEAPYSPLPGGLNAAAQMDPRQPLLRRHYQRIHPIRLTLCVSVPVRRHQTQLEVRWQSLQCEDCCNHPGGRYEPPCRALKTCRRRRCQRGQLRWLMCCWVHSPPLVRASRLGSVLLICCLMLMTSPQRGLQNRVWNEV